MQFTLPKPLLLVAVCVFGSWGCAGASFVVDEEELAGTSSGSEAENADDATGAEPIPKRYLVMTEELNAQLMGCPKVCERMEASGCEGFRSLAGCYEVCDRWYEIIPDACQSPLYAYFECRQTAPFECNARGLPQAQGCDEVDTQLDACVATAP